jgi:hypothetical protein
VITGGLIQRPGTTATSPARFVAQLYDERGAEDDFDAVGLHPYGESARDPLRIAERVRKEIDEAGGKRRPIWITEIGWGSAGEADRPNHPLVASEPGQARLLGRSFGRLADAAGRLRLGALLWYSWLDLRPFTNPGSWDSHAGLFTLAGRKKPAWNAFAKAAGGRSGGDL